MKNPVKPYVCPVQQHTCAWSTPVHRAEDSSPLVGKASGNEGQAVAKRAVLGAQVPMPKSGWQVFLPRGVPPNP